MSRSAKQRIPATARQRAPSVCSAALPISPPVKNSAKVLVCSCGSSDLQPLKTEWYEWLLTLSFLPFQCHWCGLRIWRIKVRRRPFVWFDLIMDALTMLTCNPILRAILVIVLTGAAGALLGYLLSKVVMPNQSLKFW